MKVRTFLVYCSKKLTLRLFFYLSEDKKGGILWEIFNLILILLILIHN